MRLIKKKTNINFLGQTRRKIALAISVLVVVVSLYELAVEGVRIGRYPSITIGSPYPSMFFVPRLSPPESARRVRTAPSSITTVLVMSSGQHSSNPEEPEFK